MKNFLTLFFESDSYKLIAENKGENYAPKVESFMESFKSAIQDYKKLGFNKINDKYIARIKASSTKEVINEIVS